MSQLAKAYEPQAVEEKWYAWWLEQGCFHADPASLKPAYSIVIPPPNVTGMLTLGHVLNNTIQDILARRARMTGHEVLWLPGTDHAGIATQNMVEKMLRKEGVMKHRDDLGREELLKRIWEWKEKYGGIIINQLKKLGCSCDWERERFTMDEAYARKVQEVFVDLYKKGLIYRGKRMVNWCPASLTALSDEEVIPTPQKGFLYHFKVEVIEEPGTFLEIATTRPETIMGDTAVAVNPKDPRYRHLIGKTVRRPLPVENQVALPVIGDEAVDFEFGTGVLKVTPAHDKADHEIGLRHNLPVIDIMNPDGTMNELAGEGFTGLDRFEARMEAVERLRQLEILGEEKPYENNVGFSERAGVPIESRLSEQWFLKYPKTVEARDAVRNGLIKFFPNRWEKVYDHWLENIQDWCISRQLWWGHRIPVWYQGDHRESKIENRKLLCQIESPGEGWVQDPDVLDTWFSSWLWAHDTMDDATRKKFYPTSALVTGPDIIFFWVARMIMAGLEYTGEVPFRDVYFTGLIRDKQGRKMSKTLGNSPDPLVIIEKYGADGLRFGLMRIAPQGQDIKFDEQQIVEGRNFCNKFWNSCRFRLLQGEVDPNADPAKHPRSIFAQDLLAKLDATIVRIEAAYADYRFSEVAQALYDFVWGDFCDRFIEAAKADFNDSTRKVGTLAVIDYTIKRVLLLLHPYAPFITEELWHGLGFSVGSIQYAEWPKVGDAAAEPKAEAVFRSVAQARTLRATFNLPSNKRLRWLLQPEADWVKAEFPALGVLVHAETMEVVEARPAGSMAACPTEIGIFYLPLDGVVDPETEGVRLDGEMQKVRSEIEKVQRKLASETFVQNAPAEVVAEHRQREADWENRLAALQSAREALG